jgi:glycerol-1-phosphate dehydrogenase [NAD(P)+]
VADAEIDRTLLELTHARAPNTTHHVAVGHGLAPAAAAWIHAAHPDTEHVLVCDAHTGPAAAQALRAALVDAGASARLHVVEPGAGDDHVVCDDAQVDALRAHLGGASAVNAIAVGAGTINDIVKMATARLQCPYQAYATAASMNGYTSAIAAVLSRGVKRTLPAQPAQAVFADIDVVAAAPAYLNQAGFGDLLSKPYSHADWRLSHLVRGVDYEEGPARLLDTAYDALLDAAADVAVATRRGGSRLRSAVARAAAERSGDGVSGNAGTRWRAGGARLRAAGRRALAGGARELHGVVVVRPALRIGGGRAYRDRLGACAAAHAWLHVADPLRQ